MFEIKKLRPQQLVLSGLDKRSGLKSTIAFLDMPSDAPPRPIFGCSSCSLDCLSHSDSGLGGRPRVAPESVHTQSSRTALKNPCPWRHQAYRAEHTVAGTYAKRRIHHLLGHHRGDPRDAPDLLFSLVFRSSAPTQSRPRRCQRDACATVLCCTSAVRRRRSQELDWSGISNADIGP